MDETDASAVEAAARECYEETMGLLGSLQDIIHLIQRSGKFVIPTTQGLEGTAAEYLVRIKWESDLPKRFENVYSYFLKCAEPHPYKIGYDYIPTCPDGYLEKTRLRWCGVENFTDNPKYWDTNDVRPEAVPSLYVASNILVGTH